MSEDKKVEEPQTPPPMYFGHQQIEHVEDCETEGYKRVTLKLNPTIENVDGSKDVSEKISVPEWELTALSGFMPIDFTEQRNKRAIYVVSELFDVLQNLDVRSSEVPFYMSKLINSLETNANQAILKAYGVTEDEDIRFSHIDALLKK